jgi:hypothetical protein
MSPIVLAMPTLVRPPAIDEKGMLRLTGSFDLKPNALFFDLVFQPIDGAWRLDGIAAQFRAPEAATGGQPANVQATNPPARQQDGQSGMSKAGSKPGRTQ